MTLEARAMAETGPMFAPRRGSLKDQISVHHAEGEQTARTTHEIYARTLPSLHFLRWRPMFHLLAPNAWMNDPCAPTYDPTTRLYHISFQWNPRRNRHGNVSWGNIAWGHATSIDLLSWNLSSAPSLKPHRPYDEEGIFTGYIIPTGVDGSPGKMTAIYTSVSGEPVHYTLPYMRGCETLSVAQSTDGGKSWTKSEENPILMEPPSHLQPCGWRDPYIAPWESLDKALGLEANGSTLYGMVSGGLTGQTPTLFLYAVDRTQLDKWQFISQLVDLGLNHRISRWSGDMGQNWEVSNFMTLTDDEGVSLEFLIVGAEGCQSNDTSKANGLPLRSTHAPRTARSQQWMSGDLVAQRTESGANVEMRYRIGGRFDHGCLYGANSFWDPINLQRIAWGWITEEDLPQHLVDRQNWSGLLSLPRELKLLTLRNVARAWSSELNSITTLSIYPSPTQPHLNTVRTLGISPATTLTRLRTSSRELSLPPNLTIPTTRSCSPAINPCTLDIQTCRFELSTSISISPTLTKNATINISISHSPNHDLLTTLTFSPHTETLTLHRPDSSSVDSAINTTPEIAPHTLFTFRDPDTNVETVETYDVNLWFDESVLEIFANGRTVISSRIYPGRKRVWGLAFWIGDDDGADVAMTDDDDDDEAAKNSVSSGVGIVQAKAWDGLRADIRIV